MANEQRDVGKGCPAWQRTGSATRTLVVLTVATNGSLARIVEARTEFPPYVHEAILLLVEAGMSGASGE